MRPQPNNNGASASATRRRITWHKNHLHPCSCIVKFKLPNARLEKSERKGHDGELTVLCMRQPRWLGARQRVPWWSCPILTCVHAPLSLNLATRKVNRALDAANNGTDARDKPSFAEMSPQRALRRRFSSRRSAFSFRNLREENRCQVRQPRSPGAQAHLLKDLFDGQLRVEAHIDRDVYHVGRDREQMGDAKSLGCQLAGLHFGCGRRCGRGTGGCR